MTQDILQRKCQQTLMDPSWKHKCAFDESLQSTSSTHSLPSTQVSQYPFGKDTTAQWFRKPRSYMSEREGISSCSLQIAHYMLRRFKCNGQMMQYWYLILFFFIFGEISSPEKTLVTPSMLINYYMLRCYLCYCPGIRSPLKICEYSNFSHS